MTENVELLIDITCFSHYVSVNSKPDHPPRAIFLMDEFPTPRAKKEFQTRQPKCLRGNPGLVIKETCPSFCDNMGLIRTL